MIIPCLVWFCPAMSVVRISEPAEQDLAMSAEASEKVPSSPLIRLCRETFGTIAYKLIFY